MSGGFILAGLLFLPVGLVILLFPDFYWLLTETDNAMHGIASERNVVWDTFRVILGAAFCLFGAGAITLGLIGDRLDH